ncbi:MAG: regulatory protein RecX [Chloroflexota bacterium]
MKITSLESGRGGKRITVHLGTSRRISLDSEAVAAAGLKVGQEIDVKALARLRTGGRFQAALETSLRFLEYRLRSEKEVRDRLSRSGYSSNIIDRVVTQLRARKLVDDRTFARFWCEGRTGRSPRGRRLVISELVAKGVARETAETMTADLEDEAAAYEAGHRKARSLAGLDYNAFRRKLGSYLQRRGFDYEVITRTVKRLWHEQPS